MPEAAREDRLEADGRTRRTHRSAVVVIPPEHLWEPVQRIRREHDRQIDRWMPHVTLVYPFRPEREFHSCAHLVERACRRVEPFTVALARFGFFEHGEGGTSFTMWLDPEPNGPAVELQSALVDEFPDCDDTSRFEHGFRPHMSVGQARGRERLDALLSDFARWWEPLEFTAREVAMIARGPGAAEAFRVRRAIRLGRA